MVESTDGLKCLPGVVTDGDCVQVTVDRNGAVKFTVGGEVTTGNLDGYYGVPGYRTVLDVDNRYSSGEVDSRLVFPTAFGHRSSQFPDSGSYVVRVNPGAVQDNRIR